MAVFGGAMSASGQALGVMKARAVLLIALFSACTPEPKDLPETNTTAQQPSEAENSGTSETTTQVGSSSSSSESTSESSQSSSSETKTNPGLPALEVHALTPASWSGRRLRRVYQAGDDGSIGTRLDLFWDLELNTYCELDSLDRELGAKREIGTKLYCFPHMGTKRRCAYWYKDAQCTQKVLIAGADTDEVYRELYYIFESEEKNKDCDDRAAGLYNVDTFNEKSLERVYRFDGNGTCVAEDTEAPYHTVELGEKVPMELIASGSIVVE